MPKPKAVKIAGVDVKEVLGVKLAVHTPVGPRGDYNGRTAAATVQLYRRARNTPTSELFKCATNEDGRLNIISGTISLENSKKKETYTIDMKKAFISGWEIVQPPDDDDLVEVTTIEVGEMSLSGGGKSKTFTVKEFDNAD